MHRIFCAALLLLTGIFQPSRVPEIAFDGDPDFLKLPDNLYFGEVAGVAVNSQGHVFVFSRSNSKWRFGPVLRESGGSPAAAWARAPQILRVGRDMARSGVSDAALHWRNPSAGAACWM